MHISIAGGSSVSDMADVADIAYRLPLLSAAEMTLTELACPRMAVLSLSPNISARDQLSAFIGTLQAVGVSSETIICSSYPRTALETLDTIGRGGRRRPTGLINAAPVP